MWHRTQIFWVQHIVLEHASFSVSDVLQHVRRGYIAECPHAVGSRAAVIINFDASVLTHLDAGGIQVHLIAVRHASGGDQQDICFLRAAVVIGHADTMLGIFHLTDVQAKTHVDSVGHGLVEARLDVLIQVFQQLLPAHCDGNVRA